MFDSPPANLPVEPAPAPAPTVPPPVPQPSAPVPTEPPLAPSQEGGSGKKEPEDIFAGLDRGAEPVASASAPAMEEPHTSPLKLGIIAIVIILMVGGIGVGVWYFFIRPKAATFSFMPAKVSTAPAVIPSEPEPVIEVPPPLPPEPINVPSPTPTPSLPPPPPVIAPDSDQDGLSDTEEPLFGTDSANADSDGDGYSDGAELQSGYDPTAPQVKLADSARISVLRTRSGYAGLAPSAWTWTEASPETIVQAIDTKTAARFDISENMLSDKPADVSAEQWITSIHSLQAGELVPFRTIAGLSGWKTSDGLRTYIQLPDRILLIDYNLGGGTSIDFRGAYDLLINTLRRPS